MKGLTAGRMVHYVLPDLSHRPAIVTAVKGDYANLQVFLDGDTDQEYRIDGTDMLWCESRVYSMEPKPGTWHWIEQV